MATIVSGLQDVLTQQAKVDGGDSDFILFHVVQALGQLGWSARKTIADLQTIRGRDPLLDKAIDAAITTMQNAPAPQAKVSNMTPPMPPAMP
jgi:hypothetical protein